jgi:hypothetical protein
VTTEGRQEPARRPGAALQYPQEGSPFSLSWGGKEGLLKGRAWNSPTLGRRRRFHCPYTPEPAGCADDRSARPPPQQSGTRISPRRWRHSRPAARADRRSLIALSSAPIKRSAVSRYLSVFAPPVHNEFLGVRGLSERTAGPVPASVTALSILHFCPDRKTST